MDVTFPLSTTPTTSAARTRKSQSWPPVRLSSKDRCNSVVSERGKATLIKGVVLRPRCDNRSKGAASSGMGLAGPSD